MFIRNDTCSERNCAYILAAALPSSEPATFSSAAAFFFRSRSSSRILLYVSFPVPEVFSLWSISLRFFSSSFISACFLVSALSSIGCSWLSVLTFSPSISTSITTSPGSIFLASVHLFRHSVSLAAQPQSPALMPSCHCCAMISWAARMRLRRTSCI